MAVRIPALLDKSQAADGDSISNPAINGHNGAETKINRNPYGAPQLVLASVPFNDTIAFGDDFSAINPPVDYKHECGIACEHDYLLYDSTLSYEDLFRLSTWLDTVLIDYMVDELGEQLVDEFGDPLVAVF